MPSRTELYDDVVDVTSLSLLDAVETKDIFLVVSSRTDPDDDVVDATSFSVLDVAEEDILVVAQFRTDSSALKLSRKQIKTLSSSCRLEPTSTTTSTTSSSSSSALDVAEINK